MTTSQNIGTRTTPAEKEQLEQVGKKLAEAISGRIQSTKNISASSFGLLGQSSSIPIILYTPSGPNKIPPAPIQIDIGVVKRVIRATKVTFPDGLSKPQVDELNGFVYQENFLKPLDEHTIKSLASLSSAFNKGLLNDINERLQQIIPQNTLTTSSIRHSVEVQIDGKQTDLPLIISFDKQSGKPSVSLDFTKILIDQPEILERPKIVDALLEAAKRYNDSSITETEKNGYISQIANSIQARVTTKRKEVVKEITRSIILTQYIDSLRSAANGTMTLNLPGENIDLNITLQDSDELSIQEADLTDVANIHDISQDSLREKIQTALQLHRQQEQLKELEISFSEKLAGIDCASLNISQFDVVCKDQLSGKNIPIHVELKDGKLAAHIDLSKLGTATDSEYISADNLSSILLDGNQTNNIASSLEQEVKSFVGLQAQSSKLVADLNNRFRNTPFVGPEAESESFQVEYTPKGTNTVLQFNIHRNDTGHTQVELLTKPEQITEKIDTIKTDEVHGEINRQINNYREAQAIQQTKKNSRINKIKD